MADHLWAQARTAHALSLDFVARAPRTDSCALRREACEDATWGGVLRDSGAPHVATHGSGMANSVQRAQQIACTWWGGADQCRGDADVNEQTKSGMTPLMCAVKVLGPKDGDDGIVSFLLESKANINAQDIMGDTALHIACCSKVCSRPLILHHLSTLFALSVSASFHRRQAVDGVELDSDEPASQYD